LDGHAAKAHWIEFDADSTHAHRVYWPNKKCVSVECNVRFTSSTVTIHLYLPFPSNQTSTTTMTPSMQPAVIQVPFTMTYLPTLPISKVITTTSISIQKQKVVSLPPATDSEEEELPDEEEE
jgi:hypothetical protein